MRARAAIVFDYPAWWGTELDSHPSRRGHLPGPGPRALPRAVAAERHAWTSCARRRTCRATRWSSCPTLYLVTDADAANIAGAAERGASVLVTYFSGIADEHDHIRLGGYPGAFRELLGVRTEEFWALQDGETLTPGRRHARRRLVRADPPRAGHVGGRARSPTATSPAGPPSRGDPSARGPPGTWATRLDADGLQGVTDALIAEAGLTPEHDGVEAVRRVADDGRSWLFVLNHTTDEVKVPAIGPRAAPRRGRAGSVIVAPGAVAWSGG